MPLFCSIPSLRQPQISAPRPNYSTMSSVVNVPPFLRVFHFAPLYPESNFKLGCCSESSGFTNSSCAFEQMVLPFTPQLLHLSNGNRIGIHSGSSYKYHRDLAWKELSTELDSAKHLMHVITPITLYAQTVCLTLQDWNCPFYCLSFSDCGSLKAGNISPSSQYHSTFMMEMTT